MTSWFVFYTYPKAEKSVLEHFSHLGFTVYLPLVEHIRQWHDRKKKLKVPLFPNYIFVLVERCNIYKVLSHPRVVRVVSFNGIPAKLDDGDIEKIKKIVSNCSDLNVDSRLEKGSRVEILEGPLKGLIGILKTDFNNNKHICINIPSIQYSLCLTMSSGTFRSVI